MLAPMPSAGRRCRGWPPRSTPAVPWRLRPRSRCRSDGVRRVADRQGSIWPGKADHCGRDPEKGQELCGHRPDVAEAGVAETVRSVVRPLPRPLDPGRLRPGGLCACTHRAFHRPREPCLLTARDERRGWRSCNRAAQEPMKMNVPTAFAVTWTIPTRRVPRSVSAHSAQPVRAVGTAATTPKPAREPANHT